jgi:ribosomal protein S18 acetylase RimI-like enzyme
MKIPVQYFKRFRMEFDLTQCSMSPALLPDGYRWVEWSEKDVDRHALVKLRSFRDEVDAEVFSSLGDFHGCQRLMREICHTVGFLGCATWMIAYCGDDELPVDCGTIQGLSQSTQMASIQNVGVVPEHRGMGLGRALVLKSLEGFALTGHKRALLEVTACNESALRLYRNLGFRVVKTMYRSAPVEEMLSF